MNTVVRFSVTAAVVLGCLAASSPSQASNHPSAKWPPAPKTWHPTSLVRVDASGCWIAECLLDGMTPHWEETFSTYQEAEQARADHERNYNSDGRHQTLTEECL